LQFTSLSKHAEDRAILQCSVKLPGLNNI
jgi:hypothetical protein